MIVQHLLDETRALNSGENDQTLDSPGERITTKQLSKDNKVFVGSLGFFF